MSALAVRPRAGACVPPAKPTAKPMWVSVKLDHAQRSMRVFHGQQAMDNILTAMPVPVSELDRFLSVYRLAGWYIMHTQ